MNKDVVLGILIGFILTVVLVSVGGFLLYSKLAPMFGLPGASQLAGNGGSYQQQPQSQGNGTLFGCPELKLVGSETVKAGIPFTVQNTDSKPHAVSISGTEYNFSAGEEKSITIGGWGIYHPGCDGSTPANTGELNVEK